MNSFLDVLTVMILHEETLMSDYVSDSTSVLI